MAVNRINLSALVSIMAFSLDFIGVKWLAGKYSLEHIPGEAGDVRRMLQDPRFREVGSDAGYMDLYAVLSPAEVLDIARPHYEALAKSWRTIGKQAEAENQLEAMAAALREAHIVIAHLFEWESGLD